jgi:hypothetical protein
MLALSKFWEAKKIGLSFGLAPMYMLALTTCMPKFAIALVCPNLALPNIGNPNDGIKLSMLFLFLFKLILDDPQ